MNYLNKIEMERKLASIRKVENVIPIEGADMIEVSVVGGWKVVTKKGDMPKNIKRRRGNPL